MSHISYGFLFCGKTKPNKVNKVNVLINRALKCIHYKRYNENVRNNESIIRRITKGI